MLNPTAILIFLNLISSPARAIEVAVTIDDLPKHGDHTTAEAADKVLNVYLDAFKNNGIYSAVGMVNGNSIDADPKFEQVLEKWVAAGFSLGNHTYAHTNLNTESPHTFIEDIQKNEALLDRLAGKNAIRWFRYPFLIEGNTVERRESVRDYLFSHNYRVAPVTVEFDDWAWGEPYLRCVQKNDQASIEWLKYSHLEAATSALEYSQEFAKKMIGREVKHVLLLHFGVFQSLVADRLFSRYAENGVKFISLEDATNLEPIYGANPNQISDGSLGFLFQFWMMLGQPITPPARTPTPYDLLDQICR